MNSNNGVTIDREPLDTVAGALAHGERLLAEHSALAMAQAQEILKVAPNHPPATLLLGQAMRANGNPAGAAVTLKALVDAQPNWAQAHYELGLCYSETGQEPLALQALRRAAELKPDHTDVWRALGDAMTLAGSTSAADSAYANHIRASTRDPRLLAAATALCDGQIPTAEALLRQHLLQFPTDVAAIRMLAEVAARLGRMDDAEQLLERCLELAPGFSGARYNYALVLHRQNKPAASLVQIDQLLRVEPRNLGYRNLRAVVLARVGEYQESIEIYAAILASNPGHAKIWLSYAHALSTAGREVEGVTAYRRAIDLQPWFGEAYWSLANLKTYRFDTNDLSAMQRQLTREDLSNEDRFHLHFSIGKAFEDLGNFGDSFAHYSRGNELRRSGIAYDPNDLSERVRRSKAIFSRSFFTSRNGYGCDAPDPIFVVGMPRAGSTLVEQILASHSLVEGTMEMPNIISIARTLNRKFKRTDTSRYPEVLADLGPDECRTLGLQYLEDTRVQRKTAKPYFVDKMPNNFMHLGLIQLILPNARIIDARRHPMACCFSGFKQHFAQGQNFSYRLEDIGRYYRDYVDLLEHLGAALPGKIYRVHYEQMIGDTEKQIRGLLEYCGLPFEEACLRFYENDRAVRTASAQQVRQPIYRGAVEHWRNYEPWLGPLARELGDTVCAYLEPSAV